MMKKSQKKMKRWVRELLAEKEKWECQDSEWLTDQLAKLEWEEEWKQ